eukprot:1159822-Pelagomonas_calceolata.AAC.7
MEPALTLAHPSHNKVYLGSCTAQPYTPYQFNACIPACAEREQPVRPPPAARIQAHARKQPSWIPLKRCDGHVSRPCVSCQEQPVRPPPAARRQAHARQRPSCIPLKRCDGHVSRPCVSSQEQHVRPPPAAHTSLAHSTHVCVFSCIRTETPCAHVRQNMIQDVANPANVQRSRPPN